MNRSAVSTETACPLCNGPNRCVPAASGDFSRPCWCETASFSPQLLASARIESGVLACICERCALRPPCR